MIRKDWREITNVSGSGSTTKANITMASVMLAVCGLLAAAHASRILGSPVNPGRDTVRLPGHPGRRLRLLSRRARTHTLETLLASALPDEALLF
jgi:hypothetical protein